jgi:hypothetical protein
MTNPLPLPKVSAERWRLVKFDGVPTPDKHPVEIIVGGTGLPVQRYTPEHPEWDVVRTEED